MPPEQDFGTMDCDILIKGNLRKAKSWNKRFFVLRDCSPAKLEYYENERKWKTNGSKPKRTISLQKPWNIDKKKDAKHDYLIVIFTEDEYFTMAADTPEVQENWVLALQRVVKQDPNTVLYKHMWLVTLDNKELDGSKSSRLHGPHLACLTHDQLILIQANSNGGLDPNGANPVEIPISSIRMCGCYKERMFFEPGRGSGIGRGRLWINVHDECMASNMNDNILNMMYVKQEEGAGYRNRSYSSGSNSSRSRSIRSHYNNPPPSIIGMKKTGFGASSKRLRCDSLPVTHLVGLHDPRFRTGSEGEHTLRSSRCHSIRSHNGSISPGMRNRLWMMRRRNSFAHHRQHHHVTYSHTSSHSGSLIASNASSSAEQIDSDLSLSATSDGVLLDELSCSNTSPPSSFLSVQRNGSMTRHAKRYTGNWTSPIRERLETPPHDCICSSMCGQSHFSDAAGRFAISEQAPPPPEVDPPRNPLDLKCNREYVNTCYHAKARSLDENSCSSIQDSSLSSSPHQNSSSTKPECDSFSSASEPVQLEVPSFPDSSLPSTPKRRSPPVSPTTASSVNNPHPEEKFQEDNRYPHQKISPNPEPNLTSGSSFLSKITSSLTHSRDSPSDFEYTPMTSGSSELKSSIDGYVPMRSYPLRSTPKDIRGRRRSTPDVSGRNIGPSPPPCERNSTRSICNICRGCISTLSVKNPPCSKSPKPSLGQTTVTVASNESPNLAVSNPIDSARPAPPNGDFSRVSTLTPAEKSSHEDLNMDALQEEVSQMKLSLDQSNHSLADATKLSPYSTESADLNCDPIGYVPMNPINPGVPIFRKNVFNSILSVAESNKATPMYPHQRKDCTSASKNKRSRSFRSRRPKSLSFCRSGSLSKRNRKQIPVRDASPENRASPPPPPNRSCSPGGDYVNIDYKKALEQLNSGYVSKLTPTDGLPKSVRTEIDSNDAEYTAMSFNAF